MKDIDNDPYGNGCFMVTMLYVFSMVVAGGIGWALRGWLGG